MYKKNLLLKWFGAWGCSRPWYNPVRLILWLGQKNVDGHLSTHTWHLLLPKMPLFDRRAILQLSTKKRFVVSEGLLRSNGLSRWHGCIQEIQISRKLMYSSFVSTRLSSFYSEGPCWIIRNETGTVVSKSQKTSQKSLLLRLAWSAAQNHQSPGQDPG